MYFRHGLHGFFRFAQQHVTDKFNVNIHKDRVNPCNPCLKKSGCAFRHTHTFINV